MINSLLPFSLEHSSRSSKLRQNKQNIIHSRINHFHLCQKSIQLPHRLINPILQTPTDPLRQSQPRRTKRMIQVHPSCQTGAREGGESRGKRGEEVSLDVGGVPEVGLVTD